MRKVSMTLTVERLHRRVDPDWQEDIKEFVSMTLTVERLHRHDSSVAFT